MGRSVLRWTLTGCKCRKKLVKLVEARSRSVEGRGLRKMELHTLDGSSLRVFQAPPLWGEALALISGAVLIRLSKSRIDLRILVYFELAIGREAHLVPRQRLGRGTAGDVAILIVARAVAGASEARVGDAHDASEMGAGVEMAAIRLPSRTMQTRSTSREMRVPGGKSSGLPMLNRALGL